jgi:hypothetical protein
MSNGSHSRNVIQHRTDQVLLLRTSVPRRRGYISESNMSDASICESQTFASLGVRPASMFGGGSDPAPNSFAIAIEAPAAPEPESSSSLLLVALRDRPATASPARSGGLPTPTNPLS